MKLEQLYEKQISRKVNPAVSATKFEKETVEVEIEEYVFTDEILNGLYKILEAIKNNKGFNHVGIWIDGYYGSGKSHFLKYLDYCINEEYRNYQDAALSRLLDAVKEIDPFDDRHDINFSYENMSDVANWLRNATIQTCIFNLETSYDNSVDRKKAFLHVFWNEFNAKRGFNKFNITLAQHLEKPLQEKGVFEEFKQRIADEGGDWNNASEAADLIDNELDWVLDIACELAPTLTKDSIRERIINRDTNVSIERFCAELAAFLKDKGDNYRLILLADEVSQFINKEKDRYLNLQEIITKLSESCGNKVWVACTAQQDLSEILDDCNIAAERDAEGKIKGRFEVNVSLKGTQPEVITQKRILDKKAEVKPMLRESYNRIKAAFPLQFKLPSTYESYNTEDDFVDYYPFVPYQFKLIMNVFNSFQKLDFVAKEVKGNERSIIKVVHATAKKEADKEVGKFISFDELYNSMFEEGLQNKGQKAIESALSMAKTYVQNPQMARRVTNVLFMICNLTVENDKLLFPANIDNITSLLVNDIETPRLTIKDEVEKIVDFLCDNNVLRREEGKNGAADTFSFYTEEEMTVAKLIRSQTVDNNTQAEVLRDIFFKYFGNLKNKETYLTRSFALGAVIKQRQFLANNADVVVEFAMDNDYESPENLAITNPANRLVFYLGPQFRENKKLFNAFYWCCQVDKYMATPVTGVQNEQTRKEFSKRATEQKDRIVTPLLQTILDTCPVVSGQRVIDPLELGSRRAADRYNEAMRLHFASIYTKGKLVDSPVIPRTSDSLKRLILRPVNPGDYEGTNAMLTTAEHEVEIYLNRSGLEVNVADILHKFSRPPYGWDSIPTLYVLNELVRRHKRDYSYTNNPNVDKNLVAQRLLTESGKFTVREAVAIPQDLLNRFKDAWRDIFGIQAALGTNDSTQLFQQSREPGVMGSLATARESYIELQSEIASYPFDDPIRKAIELFGLFLNERDPQRYFQLVVDHRQEAHELMDRCKEVVQFTHDQLGKYKELLSFAKSNEYNFPFVPANYQEHVTRFVRIADDEWPIGKLREYIKLKNEISAILDEVRNDKREKIRVVYNEQFDYLERIAEEQGVPKTVLSDREATIMVKTAPDNIMVLNNNINTDPFYQEQVARILDYKKPGTPLVSEPGSGSIPPAQSQNKIRQAALNTKTQLPLKTEEDIDRYLKGLKDQLLKLMTDHDGIMIVK